MGRWGLVLTLGCGPSDPWRHAPPLPETIDAHQFYALQVQDRTVGFEARISGHDGADQVTVRRRTWSLVLGGDTKDVYGGSHLRHRDGVVQAYTRWSPEGGATWEGSAWVVDAVPPPHSGLWPVLDPWTLEVRPIQVDVDAGRVTWTGSGGPAVAAFDAAGLAWAEQGAVRIERREAAPADLEALDPVALLVIPVAPQASARRSLVGRFTVDGRKVRIDAPIWPEVPALALPEPPVADPLTEQALVAIGDARDQRVAVQRLVAAVEARLDHRPTPGSMAAVDALRSGRGDCDEAATAFVALARAVGLDAETVGGLIYADGALGPGMYPHAWATVRIGGRNVPVDPGLGQAPADASHVPLGAGSAQAAARLTAGVQLRVVELR